MDKPKNPKLPSKGGLREHHHIGRPHAPIARDKGTFLGQCDGTKSVLAKLNGASATLAMIHNLGKCDVTILCVDNTGNTIKDTEQVIHPQGLIALYVAPLGTDSIDMKCGQNATTDECKIELLA